MSAPMREATHTYRRNREGLGEPLQTLFGVGTLAGLTDGQLLERFTEGRGEAMEAAFTALVERHGPMVLGVCQAVLGDRHDAEDAFQATFLVLALRAGSIRRGDAVASWLYSAARRVALRARRQAARHRERERGRAAKAGAAEPVSAPPADPWPELYEELDRLPEPFRAAVVLCDLEGHSYEQAARMLHCPVGTVQSRLARGRQRLRKRLETRGVSSAVVLVGIGTGLTARSATAAVSSHLATAIAKTAVSIAEGQSIVAMVPKTVAALVGLEIRRLLMTRALTVLTTLVMAGLVAAAGIGLVIAGQRDEPIRNPTATSEKTDAGLIHVRLVDGEGNGVPRVPVEAIRGGFDPRQSFPTDAEGFVLILRKTVGEQFILFAERVDRSMAWTMVGDPGVKQAEGTRADPIVMKLLPQTHRVTGSVLDQSGKPVPGVEVTVKSLSQPANRSVFLGDPLITGRLPRAVADPSGRFALTLPEDTGVWLSVRHSRYVGETMVRADAKVLEPMVLEPAGGIAGTLIDDTTSRPVAGASVGAQIVEWRKKNLGGWGEAITDAQGKFVIVGLEPGVYDLMLMNVPGRAHATALAVEGVRVRAGVNSAANLTLFEGRPLPGVVIDQENNQPLAGIPVGCYGPARPQAGFRVQAQRELTDEQGRFTFYVPPGEHYVHIMEAVMSGRRGNRIVIVPERGEIEPVRLFRSNPAAANSSTLDMRKVAIEPAELEKVVAVDQEQANAEQKETRKAVVRLRQEAVMKAKEDVKPSAPVVRTVTGHLRDQQGRPIPGVTVQVNPEPGTEPFDLAVTDRDGLFVYEGLPRRLLNINLARPDLKTIQTEPLPPDRDTVEWTCRSDVDASKKRLAAPTVDEPIPAKLRGRLTFVDLAPRGSDLVAEGPGGNGNDLNRLPRGVHKLGAAYFRISEMMVHVWGRMSTELPQAVKGIKVQASGNRLHILHATQWVVDPGTVIGAYLIHYTDGSNERIPIVYGRNLVNWWNFLGRKEEPTGAQVAWTGSSDSTDMNAGIKIRLFATTWTNPHLEKEVATLDILSAGTECDPFLVAVTLERDK